MTPAVALVRVSTLGQQDKQGPEVQLQAIRAYAARSALELVRTVQVVVSGASETRADIEAVLRFARPGYAVIYSNSSRLGRDVEFSARWLKLLDGAGLEVHNAERGRVSRGLHFYLDAAMAEEDRTRNTERMYKGRRVAAARGKWVSGRVPYAYRTDRGGVPHPDPQEAEVVRRIFREIGAGRTYYQVSRGLTADRLTAPGWGGRGGDAWHISTVRRVVRNRAYKGELWFGRAEPVVGAITPIVSPEEWAQAQRPAAHRREGYTDVLSGFLRCGLCGRVYSYQGRPYKPTGHITVNYRCSGYQNPRGKCRNRWLPGGVAAEIERELRAKLQDPALLREILAAKEPDPALAVELQRLEGDLARLKELAVVGVLEPHEAAERKAALERRRAELLSQQEPLEADFSGLVEAAQTAPLRELLRESATTVYVFPDRLEVVPFSG